MKRKIILIIILLIILVVMVMGVLSFGNGKTNNKNFENIKSRNGKYDIK